MSETISSTISLVDSHKTLYIVFIIVQRYKNILISLVSLLITYNTNKESE